MWNTENYTTAAHLLPRLLGFVYFCAIFPFLFQILGLLGKNGILPIKDYLDLLRFSYPKKRFFYAPTLFWINSSNRAILALTLMGSLFSILLMLGIYPPLFLAFLFLIYLSIVSVGQEFLSFGWESLLLEITFYTFWVSLTPIPNFWMFLCLNFLLFRFYIQAGLSKLQSYDRSWRDLTALWFHYQTQPLPNTWAWYVYKWPMSFHKASTYFMFIVELIVPFGLFFTDEIRAIAGLAIIGLQVIIWHTGNFSYLNHMTAAFSIIAFSNAYLYQTLAEPSNSLLNIFISLIGIAFLFLQIIRLWNHFKPRYQICSKWLYWLAPLHLVNRYGLFAVMTKERIEIVIEGSDDGVTWKEYLCKYKPSEVTRRPRRISPYQPRLDWQMWFLPFDSFASQNWFHLLLYQLLKGNPDVLKLIRFNPFQDQPPKYIRAVMYDYKFSTKQQKKELGWWWQREYLGLFSPLMSLKH